MTCSSIHGSFVSCLQVFKAANNDCNAEYSESPWALARTSSKINNKLDIKRNINSKYKIDELSKPSSRLPGIRALLPLPSGDLLTGGTDLKIRRWDHYRYLTLSLLSLFFALMILPVLLTSTVIFM